MKNKKGFTLIELIAVIFIISLLMTLVIPQIVNSVKGKQKDVSKSFENMIYSAADMYMSENEELYPVSNTSVYCISLEELVNEGKLTEPLKDLKTNKVIPLTYNVKASGNNYNQFDYDLVKTCTNTEGKIKLVINNQVSTTNKIKIDYSTVSTNKLKEVICEYGTTKEYGSSVKGNKTSCEISGLQKSVKYYYRVTATDELNNSVSKSSSIVTGSLGSCVIDVSSKTEYASEKTVTITPSGNISGLRIQYQLGDSVSESNWINYEGQFVITSNTNIYARLYDGNNGGATSTWIENLIDSSEPVLQIGTLNRKTNSVIIPITVNKDDETGIEKTECYYSKDDSYFNKGTVNSDKTSCTLSNLDSSETYNYKVISTNGVGLSTTRVGNTSTVDINQSILISSSNTDWDKKKTISISNDDPELKLQYQIGSSVDDSKWVDYKTPFEINNNTNIYARLTDGKNISTSTVHNEQKIDTIAPTCSFTGESTTWRKAASITATCNDEGGSKCTSATASKTWNYNSGTTTTASLSYTITDNAGNSATCSKTANVYSDNDNPTCSFTGESTTWRKAASITATCNDTGSSCTSGTASKTWTYNSGTTKTASLSYTITDNAGNSTTCSKTANVYIDNDAPTCSFSGESTTWRTSATITATCNDTGSSCTSGTASKSWAYSSGTTQTASLSYTITDNLGNSTTCSKTANVYVDKSGPSCGSYSGGSTSWTSGNRTITVGCSETTGSGCAQTSFSNTFSTTTTTAGAGITIKDKLGNTTSCNASQNIYVDKTPPSVPSLSGTNTNWTKNNIYVKPSSTDTGSGVNHYESYYSGSWHNYPTNDYFGSDRNETVYFRACDNVGNCSGNASTSIHIDKTAPTTPTLGIYYNPGWAAYNGEWTTSSLFTSAKSSDSGSGITAIYYKEGSGQWYPDSTSEFSRSGNTWTINGVWNSSRDTTVYVKVVDAVGNESASSAGKTMRIYH